MAGSLEEFFERYPADERAQAYLQNSSEEVVQRVLADFKPPREGESDYSGLLTAFVKRVRSRGAVLVDNAFGHELDDFFKRYPVDDGAKEFLLSKPLEVQRTVAQEFKPPREGEEDYSALLMSFAKRCHALGG
eukprot:CAMPEP_0170209688 /NCGR_PEP_ID=MMETSP0116_2-20130129/4434_1 /TAXON_ID=400756 /ORGANISM="Durinskia baltica, Strain CSIRO CS-38" /LENGTH=132 /DNA_ID=CAMNT_0010460171 /DNA_START=70 /DNA_END=464 /DNA_ORIENTATION=-